MKTLDEIALEVLKEMPIAPNGTGFMGWCAEYARRYRERLAQQEPVAWVLWNTVDDEPVMLYGDKPERTDFKKHFELRPLGFYAAPVLAPGMVQVPDIELMTRDSIKQTIDFYNKSGVNIEGNPSFPIQAASDLNRQYRAVLAAAKEKA